MPTLCLFFGPDFCDPMWADRCYTLEAPHDDHGLARMGEWLVGRHPAADVTINCRDVSRRHAAISYSYSADTWSITDLGSSTGTSVGGQRLEKGNPHPIRVGTRIWLAANLVSVVEDEGDTLGSGGAEPGESTEVDTKPLDYRPQVQVVEPPPAPPPPPPRTTADSIYLALQWGFSPTTRAGVFARLLVLGVVALVSVLIFD